MTCPLNEERGQVWDPNRTADTIESLLIVLLILFWVNEWENGTSCRVAFRSSVRLRTPERVSRLCCAHLICADNAGVYCA